MGFVMRKPNRSLTAELFKQVEGVMTVFEYALDSSEDQSECRKGGRGARLEGSRKSGRHLL